jgi:hypothetical protein
LPWDPLDLPWDEMPDTPGVPRDRAVRPSLDAVLTLRRDRMSTVRQVIEGLTLGETHRAVLPLADAIAMDHDGLAGDEADMRAARIEALGSTAHHTRLSLALPLVEEASHSAGIAATSDLDRD